MTEEQKKDIYYCTPNDVKEIGNIEKDVLDAKISAMQTHVEIFYINPVLTDDLVNVVKQELWNSNTGGTISSRISVLLDYIKYAEAYGVAYELIPFLNYKTSRGGIMTMTPNNANAADLDAVSYLRKNNQELLNAYLGRLKKFLDDNKDTYPEYAQNCKDQFFNRNNSINLMFY